MSPPSVYVSLLALFFSLFVPTNGFIPYTSRGLLDSMFPIDDPFRILEQSPLTVPRAVETLNLATADWRETTNAHVITLDVPGVKRENIKVEVEDNRVLRITGERKNDEEIEGEKWHRAERTSGKFWRQFRFPATADMNSVKAHLQDGVLTVTIPKLVEEKKRQPRVINIVEDANKAGEDIKASKAEM